MFATKKLVPATLATLAAFPLVAQGTATVPDVAAMHEGNESLSYPFGYTSFRSQQLVDGSAIAAVDATLTGVSFRSNYDPAGSTTNVIQNVTVTLSHSTRQGLMSQTFAQNVNGPTTVVYQGDVVLAPIPAPAGAGPMPWGATIQFATSYRYQRSGGDLLVDIRADNGPAAGSGFRADAAAPGGTSQVYGTAGTLSGSDNLGLNFNTWRANYVPGGQIDVTALTSFKSYPCVMLLGSGAPRFDLSSIGAPGNYLYVAPQASVPVAFQRSFIGWYAPLALTIPNSSSVIGAELHMQAAVVDPQANAAGLVSTEAGLVVVGSGQALPLQQISSKDPNAAAGQPEFVSDGSGGAVLQLQGTFN